MAAFEFDIHRSRHKFCDAGFDNRQAMALVDAIRASQRVSDVVTKQDLEIKLTELKCELLKWIAVGLALAQIGLLIGILFKSLI